MKSSISRENVGRSTSETDLPSSYERVIVVGHDYRLPGYVDQLGIWHRDWDGAEFQGVVDWFALK